jgi:AbrB family looped-hinge helix DNA binding protein
MMQVATLTQKGQATIPAKIRKVLHLKMGDKIAFDVKDDTVTIRKLEAFDYEYHQHLSKTVSEWDCREDNEAYNDL